MKKVVLDYWTSKPPHITSMLLRHNGDFLDQKERPEILSLLPSLEGKTVLDLAAGIGRFTAEFAKKANQVTSLDLCSHFIETNREANRSFPNIEWICSDAMKAHFPQQQFDLIFISWLLMYLTEKEIEILSFRMRQWLKPQGILFFRESCAPTTHFSQTKGYYAHYRSMRDYDRIFQNWTLLKQGNIQAYEDELADPFKCFWIYTARDSKIGRCQGGAPLLSQAKPAPKQLNLKGWAMQADLKSDGCPTPAEPIFESRAVYQR